MKPRLVGKDGKIEPAPPKPKQPIGPKRVLKEPEYGDHMVKIKHPANASNSAAVRSLVAFNKMGWNLE